MSIPHSETAFEKYKNQRKDQSPKKNDAKDKVEKSSSEDKNLNYKVNPVKYTPKHSSPKIDAQLALKSVKSEVLSEVQEF